MQFVNRSLCWVFVIGLASIAVLATSGIATAENSFEIGLNNTGLFPDITSSKMEVSYTAYEIEIDGTGIGIWKGNFIATGSANALYLDNAPPDPDWTIYGLGELGGGVFEIDVNLIVDLNAGTIGIDNTATNEISISGYLYSLSTWLPYDDYTSRLLVSGDVYNFGFTDSAVFEFEFNNATGFLVDESLYGESGGSIVGMQNFASAFQAIDADQLTRFAQASWGSSDDNGDCDTFVMSESSVTPEPSSIVGLCALLLCFGTVVVRRKRAAA